MPNQVEAAIPQPHTCNCDFLRAHIRILESENQCLRERLQLYQSASAVLPKGQPTEASSGTGEATSSAELKATKTGAVLKKPTSGPSSPPSDATTSEKEKKKGPKAKKAKAPLSEEEQTAAAQLTSHQDDRNLFVFHIPGDWQEENLHKLFRPYGNIVSAIISREPETGRNKGFGFVCYEHKEDAEKAIEALNGTFVCGKRLAVKLKEVPAKLKHAAAEQPLLEAPRSFTSARATGGEGEGEARSGTRQQREKENVGGAGGVFSPASGESTGQASPNGESVRAGHGKKIKKQSPPDATDRHSAGAAAAGEEGDHSADAGKKKKKKKSWKKLGEGEGAIAQSFEGFSPPTHEKKQKGPEGKEEGDPTGTVLLPPPGVLQTPEDAAVPSGIPLHPPPPYPPDSIPLHPPPPYPPYPPSCPPYHPSYPSFPTEEPFPQPAPSSREITPASSFSLPLPDGRPPPVPYHFETLTPPHPHSADAFKNPHPNHQNTLPPPPGFGFEAFPPPVPAPSADMGPPPGIKQSTRARSPPPAYTMFDSAPPNVSIPPSLMPSLSSSLSRYTLERGNAAASSASAYPQWGGSVAQVGFPPCG
uniref:RRM domain-containing protein n=1 Tax=Chromera velia CCMP2878 TaxID=1169474 RepID=A0A0G4IDY1_9ALVE|eukprot:Cvel_13429.t1-p1 / transcript=Cvel_13429.t1 / gene=Cvel_13429 / organism=Chromera_velia_CCMP2878 / gene_product=CUGBP Elav-like family member 2, putative / transcript_product=CUGBP Elav-like family member 2, putative / location=Cvel_scaffold916:24964-28289(+) / protein_length=588 / sequence_SO=supercontig / SO=protein_coding / is_pseudo=false